MGLAKSIMHPLQAGGWAHRRQVSQTIVLVQCGAKNRASFDGIHGANDPKVVGGWWRGVWVGARIHKQNRLRARNAAIGYTSPDTPPFSSWVEREAYIGV